MPESKFIGGIFFYLYQSLWAGVNIKQNIHGYSVCNRKSNFNKIPKLKIHTFNVFNPISLELTTFCHKIPQKECVILFYCSNFPNSFWQVHIIDTMTSKFICNETKYYLSCERKSLRQLRKILCRKVWRLRKSLYRKEHC